MSSAFHLTWSPEPLDDLRAIRGHIELTLREPRPARRQVERIRDAARVPSSGSLCICYDLNTQNV